MHEKRTVEEATPYEGDGDEKKANLLVAAEPILCSSGQAEKALCCDDQEELVLGPESPFMA